MIVYFWHFTHDVDEIDEKQRNSWLDFDQKELCVYGNGNMPPILTPYKTP